MLEFAAIVVISAVALSFITDATSGAVKMVRSHGRRSNVHVADRKLTDAL